MKRILLSVVLFSFLALGFSSCELDDGYSLDKFWVGYTTVELTDDAGGFRLLLDDGTVMELVNFFPLPSDYELEDGARMFANFTIVGDKTIDGREYYSIRLNSMQEILSKKPVYSSQLEEYHQQVGEDPIEVKRKWFSGRYFNVNFYIGANNPNTTHFINLLVNEEHPEADEDNIFVELRHNSNGDQPYHRAFGRVSFDVSEFLPEGKNAVTVHVTYTDYNGETHTSSGIYARTISKTDRMESLSAGAGESGNIQ